MKVLPKKPRTSGWQRDVIDAVTAAGWRVEERRRHILLFPPSGARPIPLTRSRVTEMGRDRKNTEAALRREGIDV